MLKEAIQLLKQAKNSLMEGLQVFLQLELYKKEPQCILWVAELFETI